MKEQLISFETAKLAKEKGFDAILHAYYDIDKELRSHVIGVRKKYSNSPHHLGADTIDDFEPYLVDMDNSMDEFVLAPTQSLLQKWLREQYGIFLTIGGGVFNGEIRYQPVTYTKDTVSTVKVQKPYYDTYEEALEKGLHEALKLI